MIKSSDSQSVGVKSIRPETSEHVFGIAHRGNRVRGGMSDVATSTLVETGTLAYREGMITELRPAPAWRKPIADFCAYLESRRLSPKTIYQRSYHLRVLGNAYRNRDPFTLTQDDLEAFSRILGSHLGRNTHRSYMASYRGFYRRAVQRGLIDRNPMEYIENIKPKATHPRPAAWDDINDAIDKAEPRVRLMIQIGATCGLRASEIAAVRTEHLYFDNRNGYMLRVPKGKGDKERHVPVLDIVAGRIQDAEPGPLFPSRKRGVHGASIKGPRVATSPRS